MVQTSKDYFLYFAYGSNLLKRRIRINNPSAVFVGIGQLNNHRFDFAKYNINWHGAVCTIVPKEHENVWGAIWKVHNDHLETLDRQEGVESKEYVPKIVEINTSEGNKVSCRSYQHSFTPPEFKSDEELPLDRRPSITYIDCITKGAIECNLPQDYIDMLKKIPNNGKHAPSALRKSLNL